MSPWPFALRPTPTPIPIPTRTRTRTPTSKPTTTPNQVMCIPVAIDGSVQMISFQIGPYSTEELTISQAYCP